MHFDFSKLDKNVHFIKIIIVVQPLRMVIASLRQFKNIHLYVVSVLLSVHFVFL